MDGLPKYIQNSIGLESLESFKIKCVKVYCVILATELIKGSSGSFAIIPESAVWISSLFLESQHF